MRKIYLSLCYTTSHLKQTSLVNTLYFDPFLPDSPFSVILWYFLISPTLISYKRTLIFLFTIIFLFSSFLTSMHLGKIGNILFLFTICITLSQNVIHIKLRFFIFLFSSLPFCPPPFVDILHSKLWCKRVSTVV